MANTKDYPSRLTFDSKVKILNGTKLSEPVDLHGTVAVALVFPAIMTNDRLTILAAIDLSGPYKSCFNDVGLELELAFKQNGYTCLSPDDMSGIRFLKFSVPNNEVIDREITIVSRGTL